MSLVHCRLPTSGLGNQLFPLLKAYTFAELNKLRIVVTGYHQLRIGPYLRGEKSKRNYSDYFVFQKGRLGAWMDQRSVRNGVVIHEPPVQSIQIADNTTYTYDEIPHWKDFFSGLKENRDRVIRILPEILRDDIKEAVARQAPPVIGVHIRMGDFRKLKPGEDFSKVGAVRTPEEYFINIIESIRRIHGSQLPVSVFTDGYRHELQELWKLGNIEMVEGNKDIVDMLLLSRSRIIVASAGSTFSYWAGFLANAPIILHPDHIHGSIRPAEANTSFFEGALLDGNTDSLLVKNIQSIP